MIDHLGIRVSDYERSKRFYELALAPIGYKLMMEGISGAGFHSGPIPDFWIKPGTPNPSVHVAFACPDRATVDAFHRAAVAAGASTTARRTFARFITRHTMVGLFSTPTDTTSRRSAISLSESGRSHGKRVAGTSPGETLTVAVR